MPLNGNIFNSSWGAESVTRYDRRLHTHDAVNPGAPYPSAVTIVGRSERSLFQLDTSFDLHISDTLWSFAIACNEDIQARVFANVKSGCRAVTACCIISYTSGYMIGGSERRWGWTSSFSCQSGDFVCSGPLYTLYLRTIHKNTTSNGRESSDATLLGDSNRQVSLA